MPVIGTTRDEMVSAMRLHRGEILEADEWRPLADHVLELINVTVEECLGELVVVYPDAVAILKLRIKAIRGLL